MNGDQQTSLDTQLTAAMGLALAGELDADQQARLAQRIAGDPELRQRWQQTVAMDVQLRAMLRPPGAQRIADGARQVVSMGTASRRVRIVHAAQRRRRQSRSRHLLWWGMTVAACLLGAIFFWRLGEELPTRSGPQLSLQIISGDQALSGDVRWGAELRTRGAVRLQVGVAHLSLDPGTRILFAGQGDDPPGTVTLVEGRGQWQIPSDSGQQIVVRSRHLRVQVVGTVFTITSDRVDDRSHLHLHSGQILVSDAADRNSFTLMAGEKIFADKDGLRQQDTGPSVSQPWWQMAKTSRGSSPGFSWHGEAGRLHLVLETESDASGRESWGGVRLPMRIPEGRVGIDLGSMSGDPGSEWSLALSEADGDVWLMDYGAIADQPQHLHLDLHAPPKQLLYQGGDGDYDPQSVRYVSIGLSRSNARLEILSLEPSPLSE